MSQPTQSTRTALTEAMIGSRIPRLWCPPISHYTATGEIDADRMAAHWATMVAHVGGFLVPGSTGDGWEMDSEEIARLLVIATNLAARLHTRVLVGVLRTQVDEMLTVIEETLSWLQDSTGERDPLRAMQARHVAGFTVCPPQGADLSQAEIEESLSRVLDLGLPTAIYQLPQITQNEIAPETFRALAARYPNFLIFKDTSGTDRVPLADRGASGVFLVRGAEGEYAPWLRESGGPYDGLLLSTANCFARELGEVIHLLETGEADAASALSQRLTDTVHAAFAAVAPLPYGNAFANANKAMDHWMAYGPAALEIEPPWLHAHVRLPHETIIEVGHALEVGGFMPAQGYLPLTT